MISSFIWKMAWRDSRSSRRRLLLFSISITLGIAALVGIGSFRHSLAEAIDDQARTLLGADLDRVAHLRMKLEEQAFLDEGAGACAEISRGPRRHGFHCPVIRKIAAQRANMHEASGIAPGKGSHAREANLPRLGFA